MAPSFAFHNGFDGAVCDHIVAGDVRNSLAGGKPRSYFSNQGFSEFCMAVTFSDDALFWIRAVIVIVTSTACLFCDTACVGTMMMAPLTDHICIVFGLCAQKQVGRIYARSHIAFVAHAQPVRNLAEMNNPRSLVRTNDDLFVHTKPPVSGRFYYRCRPHPAFAHNVNFREKTSSLRFSDIDEARGSHQVIGRLIHKSSVNLLSKAARSNGRLLRVSAFT